MAGEAKASPATDPRATDAADGGPASNGHLRFDASGVTHDYSGVVALHDVDFTLESGTVAGLVGENGSGKSTLIKILTGALRPSFGNLRLGPEDVHFHSPGQAMRRRIGVVHQDYNVFPYLSVAENVYGVNAKLPRRRWTRLADKSRVAREVLGLLEELNLQLPPDALVGSLDTAERKLVEIARAMLLKPRFLILDEPTASLEPRSSAAVLDLIDRLRGNGVGVCFVSHRLDEVIRISDRITVLRDGRVVGRLDGLEASEERLAELIVGRRRIGDRTSAARGKATAAERDSAAVALRVAGLHVSDHGAPIDFELRQGEIVGFTGLLGSGAATAVRMLGGAIPLEGRVEVGGIVRQIRTPRDASRAGIGFLPEDRKAEGIVPEQDVATNISLASLGSVSRLGIVSHSKLLQRAEEYREKLDIRLESVQVPVKSLSGGNTQKVLLAKWLASGVRILAVDEPTHGIDIGAKSQVHALLRGFAEQGGSIILASADVREVLAICDRVAVFRHGAIRDVISTQRLAELTKEDGSGGDPEHLLEALITTDE